MKSSRAFTLIEILVVIAIIGILMALLFPAVQSALNSAKKAEASNDVTQIANATLAYQTEYGTWPQAAPGNGGALVTGNLLQNLMGSNAAGGNTRMITFLEVGPWKNGKGGVTTNSTPTYEDAWGNGYYIAVDTNYVNSISGLPTWSGVTTIQKTVAVWMQTNPVYTGISGRIPATSW